MNTTNTVNETNLSNNRIFSDYFESQAIDLLKKLRFDVGKVCHHKLKYVLRLERMININYCNKEEDKKQILREELIRSALLRVKEI